MMSSVIICPVVRLDEARSKDKSVSLFIAIAIHVGIFVIGSLLFVHQPQFAVEEGESSIEVDLIAAPASLAAAGDVTPAKDEPRLEQEPVKEAVKKLQPQAAPTQKNVGQDQQTLHSTGGATTAAKPEYLKNPAPAYPEFARRQRQQGLVLLNVAVDRFGKPLTVDIKQSSGFRVLDQAAVKAVLKWKFRPAYAGALAVDSQVEVPVRFRLDKK